MSAFALKIYLKNGVLVAEWTGIFFAGLIAPMGSEGRYVSLQVTKTAGYRAVAARDKKLTRAVKSQGWVSFYEDDMSSVLLRLHEYSSSSGLSDGLYGICIMYILYVC